MATDTEFSKALTLHRSGRLAEAESLYRNILEMHAGHPGALHLLGLIEISKQEYDGAVRLIRRSIETGGPNAVRLNDLGSACRAAGDLNDAADSFRLALNLKRDLTPAWLGLAGVLRAQGRLADAIDTLEEGRQLVPRGASVDFNLATLMAESGDFERAAIAFGAICDDDPGQIAASLSLGKVLGRLAKTDEAEAVYRRSLESTPGNADLLNAIAEIRMDSGQPDSAERLLRQALENHPGHVNAWFNLGKTLLAAGRLDADFLARWLAVDGPVPGIVRRAGIEHIRRLAAFGRMADRIASADSRLRDLPGWDCARELMANPVLGLLLEKGPVDDLVLEGMLRSLRRACLLSRWADSAGERSQSESSAFLISLAQQCFHNEYIYEVEPDETEALARLRESVEHGQATTADVALLATYMPLFQLERDLLSWVGNNPQAKVELQSLLRQQVSEPLEERKLASGIESISGIEDAVSLAVRGQYEDNPYPRWHAIGRLDTHPVGLVLSGLFPFLSARQTVWPQSPDILVAGCGTGHQSIASAQRFANCHVTAIDLSLASLAYAKRETRQAGIPNIDYRQGDILELADLENRFDIIECTGVLHHMADPLAGWTVLRSLLTPGGLMKIGLYSELGRESIVAARTIVEREGFAVGPEGIRAARKLIGSLPAEDSARQVTERPDFYTMSTCRDLIFHVQEHRLTLPRISEMCETLELEFLGFELPSSDIATSFRSRFPDDPDMRSLANWDRFERDNKGVFSRMYLFWVRDGQPTA